MDGGLTGSESAAFASLADALGGEAPTGDFLADLSRLEAKARELSNAERRSRQAAATYRAASLALSRSPDSNTLLEELLDYLNWIVAYDAAVVFLAEPGGALVRRGTREWRTSPRASLVGWAAELAHRAADRILVEERGGELALCLPLRGPKGALGTALILRDEPEAGVGPRPFDEEELRAAEAFAGQAAAALQSAVLIEGLRRAEEELLISYDTSIEILSKTLDLRDHETEGHSLRVAETSLRIARLLGIDAESLVTLRRGALLHDIGKIGIPDAILLKPGPLDQEEIRIMREHPVIARDLLDDVPFLRGSIDVPWCHHERWDGMGYPRGLAAAAIPLPARIFAVVDVWDALTHDRPYRKAMTEREALDRIRAGSGNHFDPSVAHFFLATFDLY